MKPFKFYRSGLVRRWHQNPEMSQFGQNNAAHQWGVVTLVLIMFPNASRELIIAAHTHDVGELDAGDLASPKKELYPEVYEQLQGVEELSRLETLGKNIFHSAYLSDMEKGRLHLCDKLEAALFMLTFNPQSIKNDRWDKQFENMRKMSVRLGCVEKYDELLSNFEVS